MPISFPSPYPDELLYSVLARYVVRIGSAPTARLMRQLFGSSSAHAVIDLPRQLGHLASTLPASMKLIAEDLVWKFTLFPCHAPFLQAESRLTIFEGMMGTMRSSRVRIRRNSVSLSEVLCYCPKCAVQERRNLGECYWHRLHQIPGVEVCPVHEVWLESSLAPARALGGWHTFRPAESTISNPVARPLSAHEPGRDALIQLAKDAAWLLKQNALPSDPIALWKRYRYLLREQGLSSYRGKGSIDKLVARFHRMFPRSFLARVEGTSGRLTSGRGILSLIRKPRCGFPPLYHLLMMQFLWKTAEEFFQMPAEPQDFGSGPWPCLNPVGPHYRDLVVTKCSVHVQKDGARPVGTFSCGCGFEYVRVGPDWGPLAQFSYTRVERYGPLWDRKFTRLWSAPELTLAFISKAVGIAEQNLSSHAARLKLPVWRRENGRAAIPGRKRTWRGRAGRPPAETIHSMRQHWKDLSAKDGLSASESREERRLYHWLYHHDHAWVTTQSLHRGRANRDSVAKHRVDWKARDEFLAQTINDTVAALQDELHSLASSQNQLIRRSGFRHLIHPNLARLPKTLKAIKTWTDSEG